MKVIHLKVGWNDKNFEECVQGKIDEMSKEGFVYYDVKISSKDSDCLLIFKVDDNERDALMREFRRFEKRVLKQDKDIFEGLAEDD